jgi:uncharacterized protein YbjT (DUF2867 family)
VTRPGELYLRDQKRQQEAGSGGVVKAAHRVNYRGTTTFQIYLSTEFHEFILSVVEALDRVPFLALIPKGWLLQPIEAGEVAGRLVELVLGLPAGRVPDIGGPEVKTLANLTQAYLSAKSSKKGVVELLLPGKAARAFREGAQAAPASVRGDITWEEFLKRQFTPIPSEARSPQ